MNLPDLKEKYATTINTLVIGATREQGGTRETTVTVGGQSALPFMTNEGAIPHKPVIAGFVSDIVPDWPEFLKRDIGPEIGDPIAWAQKSVAEFGVDCINLKFLGADPSGKDRTPAACAKLVRDMLLAVKVPLIIWGCGVDEKDNHVLPECAQAARGENCLIGPARETNYKTVVAICKADGHKIIAEAPVDINIGKQIVILLQDAGFSLSDIVMFQTTAGLGYGLDYVYTILERARMSGLKGDKLMAVPQICDVAAETYRLKEANTDEDALPGWGPVNRRGRAWEAVCAMDYVASGADILVMAHPGAIADVRSMIDRLGE